MELIEYLAELEGLCQITPIDWRMALLGAYHEIGEALSVLPWRPWRLADQREPTAVERERGIGEMVDGAVTLLRAAILLGATSESLGAALTAHVARKHERLAAGVDMGRPA